MKAVGERSPGPLARNATETHPLPPPLVIIRIIMRRHGEPGEHGEHGGHGEHGKYGEHGKCD